MFLSRQFLFVILFGHWSEKLYFPYFCENRATKLQVMTKIPPNYKNHGPKNDNQTNCKFAGCKKLHFSWGIVVVFSSFRHFGTTRSKKSRNIKICSKNDRKMTKKWQCFKTYMTFFATCKIVMCCHFLFLFVIWWKCCYLFVFLGAVFVLILKNIKN